MLGAKAILVGGSDAEFAFTIGTFEENLRIKTLVLNPKALGFSAKP